MDLLSALRRLHRLERRLIRLSSNQRLSITSRGYAEYAQAAFEVRHAEMCVMTLRIKSAELGTTTLRA
ncbi:hypothetical protein [Schauerella aestuarii]|uniref:hypothetical protein n=1 Tax=Schauerella aestuarii TaxID=2511204 RepID=UPI001371937D|nr:hypothetical protein [Achromobacter aestuarii]MYZ43310.1 hypothetical protein [Achromobacter aestuarii]